MEYQMEQALHEQYKEAETHLAHYFSDSMNQSDEGRLAEAAFLRIVKEAPGTDLAELAMHSLSQLYGFFDTMADCAYDDYDPELHDFQKSKEWKRRELTSRIGRLAVDALVRAETYSTALRDAVQAEADRAGNDALADNIHKELSYWGTEPDYFKLPDQLISTMNKAAENFFSRYAGGCSTALKKLFDAKTLKRLIDTAEKESGITSPDTMQQPQE